MVTPLKLALVLALALQQKYSVEGTVNLDRGLTKRPITVFLEPLNARPVVEVNASAAGDFRFVNVPAGSYYVRVNHPGFEEAAQRVDVPAFDRSVVISLHRKPDAFALESEVALDGVLQVDIRQLGIPKDAVREYEKALDENKKGMTARAIAGLRRALSIAPNFIDAAFRLGSTLYDAGHFADAEKVLTQALKAAPAAAKLRLMLANVFLKDRKHDQALLQIDAYLKENPDGPERESAERTRSQLIQAMDDN